MYFKEVFLTAKDQLILSESTFLKGVFFTYQSTYIIKFKYFPICQRALVQVLSIVRISSNMSNSESSKKLPKQAGNKAKARFIAKNDMKPDSESGTTSPEELQAIDQAIDDQSPTEEIKDSEPKREPKADSPEPTSPEELQAIEQAVDDWFKGKAPAEEPTETWVE